MRQRMRLEVGAIRIVGGISAAARRVEFFGDRRDRERILPRNRIVADLLDHLEAERAAANLENV